MRNNWWVNLWLSVPMIGIILIGVGFGVARLRFAARRSRKAYEPPPMSNDFTVGELNQLCKEGKLSPEECEKAKASVMLKNEAMTQRANMKSTGGFPVIAPAGNPRKDG